LRTRIPTSPSTPFRGYHVSLVSDAVSGDLQHLASAHPALEALFGGQQSVALSVSEAVALYDAAEAVALDPAELLYLVHDGFFGPTRGRQAAIAAVEACGALPVPALALPPLRRRVPPAAAERHVDTLIEREPELHLGRGGSAA
jgi:hypothetical protein